MNWKEILVMIKRVWVMPEQRDEDFSLELINRFGFLAKSLGVSAFSIEICEKYQNEETPHYHMKVEIGICIDLPGEIGVNAFYSAAANRETYKGEMNIRLRVHCPNSLCLVLAATLFSYYDECIREYYKEWETKYEEIQFPV